MARARRIRTPWTPRPTPRPTAAHQCGTARRGDRANDRDPAIRLVAERGATRLSLVDVGRESGYSHSLPNYYFKTKKQLLVQVYTRIVGNFQQRAKVWAKAHARTPSRPGLSHLESTIGAYCNLSTDGPGARAMHALWAESISSDPPESCSRTSAREPALAADVRGADPDRDPARRDRPRVDVESLAVMIFGMLRGVVAQWLIDPTVSIWRGWPTRRSPCCTRSRPRVPPHQPRFTRRPR